MGEFIKHYEALTTKLIDQMNVEIGKLPNKQKALMNKEFDNLLLITEDSLIRRLKASSIEEAILKWCQMIDSDTKRSFRYAVDLSGGNFAVDFVADKLFDLLVGTTSIDSEEYKEFVDMAQTKADTSLLIEIMRLYIEVVYRLLQAKQKQATMEPVKSDEMALLQLKLQQSEGSRDELQSQLAQLQAQVYFLMNRKENSQRSLAEEAGGAAMAKKKATTPTTTGKRSAVKSESENEYSADSDYLATSDQSEVETDPEEGENEKAGVKGDGDDFLATTLKKLMAGQSIKKAERKSARTTAQLDNYNRISRPLPMSTLTRMLHSTNGLLMHTIDGAVHSVAMANANKTTGRKVLLCKIVAPPDGVKLTESCGARQSITHPFPRSLKQFDEDFVCEQQDLLADKMASLGELSSASVEQLAEFQKLQQRAISLQAYRRKFLRLAEVTMHPYPKQHVTVWAVLLHFHIITWNTAAVYEDFGLLNERFDERWEKDFALAARVSSTSGISNQRIEEAMLFLQHFCPTPSCGTLGMTGTHCFYCKAGHFCSGGGGEGGGDSKAKFEANFHKWKAVQIANKVPPASITRGAYKATLPADQASVSSGPSSRTIASTYDALAKDQSIIEALAASYRGAV
jgi:hypothetical protein